MSVEIATRLALPTLKIGATLQKKQNTIPIVSNCISDSFLHYMPTKKGQSVKWRTEKCKVRRKTPVLRNFLNRIGRLEICEWCRCEAMELSDGKWLWHGKELRLHIDHIHGMEVENCDAADNLRYLCPNCHTQTYNHSKSKRPKNQTQWKQPNRKPEPGSHATHAKNMRKSSKGYTCVKCKCENMIQEHNGWLWREWPIKLEINHIRGRSIPNADHIDNLEYLCPNCHAQTANWGGKSNTKN